MAEALLHSSVKKLLVPDIVFSMTYQNKNSRSGSLVCIRDDKESIAVDRTYIDNVLHQTGFAVETFSTVLEEAVCLNNREAHLNKLFNKIAGAQVVITDRLHAMILCAVTDTPCVAFDNLSGKVSETYLWLLREHPRIMLCEDTDKLEKCLMSVIHNHASARDVIDNINNQFDTLKKYLEESCLL